MSTHPLEQLSALVDGGLDDAARADVEAHLTACASCRSVLDELTALRSAAAAWRDRPAAPAADLWPGIAARLEPREHTAPVVAIEAHPAWYRRRVLVGLPELAVAATLLAAVGSALLWSRQAAPASSPASVVAPVVAEMEAIDVGPAQVVPVNLADAQYDAAVGDLEQVLRDQRDRLDPRTVIVLERNLRVIDDAIREARDALATDPANALLNAHLAGARQRKLDLLRRAAQITEGD